MLTKKIDLNETSIESALEKSGLNYIINQSEVMNGLTLKHVDGYKALYRSDTNESLSIVGHNYTVFQNYEAFSFFDIICKEHGTTINKIYEFNNGKKIVIEAMGEKNLTVGKGDICQTGYKLVNGFDGKTSTVITFEVKRLVCLNGMTASDKSMENSISLKHTKNMRSRIEEALRVFASSQEYFKIFEEKANYLAQKIIDKDMVEMTLKELFGESKKMDKVKDVVNHLFKSGKGNNGETAWDLYNGITEYADHYSRRDNDDMIEYSLGSGSQLKNDAFNLVMSL